MTARLSGAEREALTEHARLPLGLLAALAVICVATLWAPPAGRTSWALEVGPGLLEVAILVATFRRRPLSHLIYGTVFVHVLVLIYGGYYTYALTPLGNWAKEAFGLSRNHYDRVGHVALGVFPVFLARELLLAYEPARARQVVVRHQREPGVRVRGVLGAARVVGHVASWHRTWVRAFLGSQGDVWDAQWDMLLALIGAVLGLSLASRVHDRSIERTPSPR